LPFVAPRSPDHFFVSLPTPKEAHFVRTKHSKKQDSYQRRNTAQASPWTGCRMVEPLMCVSFQPLHPALRACDDAERCCNHTQPSSLARLLWNVCRCSLSERLVGHAPRTPAAAHCMIACSCLLRLACAMCTASALLLILISSFSASITMLREDHINCVSVPFASSSPLLTAPLTSTFTVEVVLVPGHLMRYF
jgi:hypothetical protein